MKKTNLQIVMECIHKTPKSVPEIISETGLNEIQAYTALTQIRRYGAIKKSKLDSFCDGYFSFCVDELFELPTKCVKGKFKGSLLQNVIDILSSADKEEPDKWSLYELSDMLGVKKIQVKNSIQKAKKKGFKVKWSELPDNKRSFEYWIEVD